MRKNDENQNNGGKIIEKTMPRPPKAPNPPPTQPISQIIKPQPQPKKK